MTLGLELVNAEFLSSLPEAYARAFAPEEISEHARIAAQRGGRLAHAEPCQAGGRDVVCLVADDRSGLLALVTDALLLHGLSIVSAYAYCRLRPDGVTEALDFLEIGPSRRGPASREGAALEVPVLEAFVQTLVELIAEDIRASMRPGAAPASVRPRTRVYFELEALRQGQYVLLVETPDSEGVLHAISSALHSQGARIVSCQIGTEASTAHDRFEIASSSAQPWSSAELCDIQFAVLSTLGALRP
jgi:UTP:GlnB (protein PII) uridylyltransferase